MPIRGDPEPATRCVLKAFSHKMPFRVRYDRQGIDSDVALGVVGAPDDQVFEIDFDGNVMGGGRTTPGLERTIVKTCPKPVVLKERWPSGMVTCLPPQPRPSPP